MENKDLAGLTHEDLAVLAQDGNDWAMEHLIRQYTGKAQKKARAYYMMGAEKEDIVQEGMIGLFKAIKKYDPNRDASFETFAMLCMDRQILSAIRSASRKKHDPLNTSISIYENEGKNEDRTLEDAISDETIIDPLMLTLIRDMLVDLEKSGVGEFSRLEIDVWNAYMSGKSYEQIAKDLGKNPKSVYNAMERIRKKVLAHITG